MKTIHQNPKECGIRIMPCVWRVGSTAKDSFKSSLPDNCIKKGCDGVMTDGIMKTCKEYLNIEKKVKGGLK